MPDIQTFLANAPVPVNFAGLEGDTRRMQSQGWQIAIETYMDSVNFGYNIRLAGKHPGMGLKVLSYPSFYDAGRIRLSDHSFLPHIRFDLWICAEQIAIYVDEVPKFGAVDFSKPYLEDNVSSAIRKHVSLEECAIFRPFNDAADIYIPEKKIWTVMDHLKEISELQKDKQAEIREKMRRKRNKQEREKLNSPNEYDQRQEVKLQLVAV